MCVIVCMCVCDIQWTHKTNTKRKIFFLLLFGSHPEMLNAYSGFCLCSAVTPGCSLGALCGIRDQTRSICMQGKCLNIHLPGTLILTSNPRCLGLHGCEPLMWMLRVVAVGSLSSHLPCTVWELVVFVFYLFCQELTPGPHTCEVYSWAISLSWIFFPSLTIANKGHLDLTSCCHCHVNLSTSLVLETHT